MMEPHDGMSGHYSLEEKLEEHFTQALDVKPAPSLKRYFNALKEGASTQDAQTITDGVNMFIRLSNLPIEKRTEHYGHQLKGLHFASDLASAWNKNHHHKLNKASILWS